MKKTKSTKMRINISKMFPIVTKPRRSFIGYVIWERVKGIVIWMFEEMCLICVTLIDGDSNTLVLP